MAEILDTINKKLISNNMLTTSTVPTVLFLIQCPSPFKRSGRFVRASRPVANAPDRNLKGQRAKWKPKVKNVYG